MDERAFINAHRKPPVLIGLIKLDFAIVLRKEEPRELAGHVAFDTEGRAWYPVHQWHEIGPRTHRVFFVRWQRAQDMPFVWEPFPTPAPPARLELEAGAGTGDPDDDE